MIFLVLDGRLTQLEIKWIAVLSIIYAVTPCPEKESTVFYVQL